MPQRPIWRGHLRLALVSCPVALFNARHSREALAFHMINPDTGNRVRMITQDADTGAELRRGDLVKGYEFEKHRYLLMDEADFDAARTETSTVMRVDKFVASGSIDPVYFDASYYMAPDGSGADDVYRVLHSAIADTGQVALSRVTIARRERAVLIAAVPGGLAVHTLLEERDLNSASEVFGQALQGPTDPEMVQLARQLITRQLGRYDPADVEDRYETRLRAVIEARLQGQGVEREEAPAIRQSNVVDLMAALRKSLGQPAEDRAMTGKAGSVPSAKSKPARTAEARQQALKLPIKGGKKVAKQAAAVPSPPPARTRRKAS